MPTHLIRCALAAAAVYFAAVATGLAEDTPQVPAEVEQPAGTGMPADRIEALIRQLDDDNFAKRQAATAELSRAGKQVIPALEQAAVSDSREATTRSIDILKKFFETGDEATQAAAKEALTRLSTCGKPSAASRAQSVLAPKPDPAAQAVPWGFPGGGIQIGGNAQIQLQVQAIGGNGAQRITTKIVNGAKEIEVKQTDRTIKIDEDAAGKIKMEITEKGKEGKQETRKYEADNADALQKNHPEAHKVYEQYGKGAGGMIRIQAGQIQPGQIPLPMRPGAIPFRRLPPGAPQGNPDAAKRIEEAKKQMEEAQKQMEEAKRRMEEIRKELEKATEADEGAKESRRKSMPPAVHYV